MLKTIEIEGFKSIESIRLDLGRINVFIGENGAGKSNILEAVALAAAAEAQKLDNEFLAARGIRVVAPSSMKPLFAKADPSAEIRISVEDSKENRVAYIIKNDNMPYSSWTCRQSMSGLPLEASDMPIISERIFEEIGDKDKALKAMRAFAELLTSTVDVFDKDLPKDTIHPFHEVKLENDLAAVGKALFNQSRSHYEAHRALQDFVIFSPENTALRTLEREGQIEPLGVNGEGLSKLLQVMTLSADKEPINNVKSGLRLFDWFEDFSFPQTGEKFAEHIILKDSYISDDVKNFDQRSANEGFLFSAFYLALFSSNLTPKIFAIDNIDASLNPKMCERLMAELIGTAFKNSKQVLLTTHNPSILDGLDLSDANQKLFVVSRTSRGSTVVRSIEKKLKSPKIVRLSNAFLSGALGAIPRNF